MQLKQNRRVNALTRLSISMSGFNCYFFSSFFSLTSFRFFLPVTPSEGSESRPASGKLIAFSERAVATRSS